MWQRIQTLYLAIAILINLGLYLVNVAQFQLEEQLHNFTLYGLIDAKSGEVLYSTVSLSVINMLSILVSLVVIFMFKKRQLQIKLSQLNLFVQVVLVAAIFFFVDSAAATNNLDTEIHVEYGLGILLAILPLVFIYLAIRAIKKDEALIRAADRIR
ncbi:MAG: DUF4293 domain-containing protein [Vicingaceae bacterium]